MMITETAVSSTVLPTGGGKIRRSSFKSRGTTSNGGAQINGGGVHTYAVRMKVPSTAIAEIASKFNAVVVDADGKASARKIIKKVNRTLARGTAIRATVEKFESATEKQHGTVANPMVLVRTNSDHRAAEVIKAAVVAEQRSPSLSSSIVKRRMEQFQAAGGPIKPKFLGPKPKVNKQRKPILKDTSAVVGDRHLLTKHKRLSIARDPDAQLESVLNASSPPPPTAFQSTQSRLLEQPPTPSPPSEHPPLPSLLSELPSPQPPPPNEVEQEQSPPAPTPSPPVVQPKLNCSFLHSRKQPTAVDVDDVERPPAITTNTTTNTTTANTTTNTTVVTDIVGDDDQRDSFLHGYKKKVADGDRHDYHRIGDDRSQDIYEELWDPPNLLPLPDVVLESTHYDGDNDHHYTTIEGCEQNIYDDVIATAAVPQDNGKRPAAAAADEDGRYETVQAPSLPPPLPPTAPVLPVTTVVVTPALTDSDDGNSDGMQKKVSDSSMEIDNSIYGLNPPSESTSSGKWFSKMCRIFPFFTKKKRK